MPRHIVKHLLPHPDKIKEHPSLRFLGSRIHDPNLWHLTRISISRGVFIGLLIAFVPLPIQMLLAALFAIIFRANLPVSVVVVWVSNPLTMAPMFYLAYKIGNAILGYPRGTFQFELSWQWLIHDLPTYFTGPFLLGCLLCGLFFGLLGSTCMRLVWRWHVIRRWRVRRQSRHLNQ